MAGRRPSVVSFAKPRPGRQNNCAPTPSDDKPKPSRYLCPAAKKIFRELARRLQAQQYASDDHRRMLGLAAMRLHEVEELTKVLDEKGYSYETIGTKGQLMIKTRPEVLQRSDAARHAQSLLAEFGLSPSSAGKVKVPKKEKESKWSEFNSA